MPRIPADEILAEHTEEIRALAQRLRYLVRRALPESEERVYPGWHGIGYRHPDAGYVCGIFPLADRVKIGFEHGASLPDPRGVLAEGGRQVRYVVIRSPEDIDERAIEELLFAAVDYGGRERR
jgi:hypothetical protein